eukprot:scaffold1402_cov403-Prasinococcus_capsulatus_cf.AAC.19
MRVGGAHVALAVHEIDSRAMPSKSCYRRGLDSLSLADVGAYRLALLTGLMPEFGTYPGGPGESPVVPFTDSKNADREIIHGRFAMLAVTGAYTAERYSGVPW